MHEPATTSDRQPPGPVPGAAVGVAAGLLVSSVWAFGSWDVAVALTTVFVGLVVAVFLGAPRWHRFGVAMALGAGAVGAAFVLVLV